MPLDLASVLFLPSNRRQVSFLSIALGLMVDLDIGTENMRWMGDTRFILGFIKGIAASKNFKCRLKLKVLEDDKVEMARKAREATKEDHRVMGGGIDPLAGLTSGMNGVKLDGDSVGMERKREAENSDPDGLDEQTVQKLQQMEQDGPLHTAEALQPDDTWLTIDSTSRGSSSVLHATSTTNTDGAWRDGDGMLYM